METHEEALYQDKKMGFLIYLAVEAVMFIVLFMTYIIFTPPAADPKPGDLFEVKGLVLSSVLLLSSSGTLIFTEKARGKKKAGFIAGLVLTLLLALSFLGVEITEFAGYVKEGYGTSANNFMGAFYALVGLHAAHVTFGAGWMIVLLTHSAKGISPSLLQEKTKIFSYYWHFVDAIWVFIIIFVYVPYL